MRSAAAQYVKEVNKRISCPGSLKRQFLRQLRSELESCCAEYPKADLSLLSRQFGAPEEMAEEFMAELSSRVVERCTKTRNSLLRLVMAVVVLAVAAVLTLAVQKDRLQRKLSEKAFHATITYAQDGVSDGESTLIWQSERE